MKDFEMSQEQLEEILDACKPVPLIAINCGMPSSPQENANAAWARLGKTLGFKHMTVKPSGKGNRFFSAEPIQSCIFFGFGNLTTYVGQKVEEVVRLIRLWETRNSNG